MKKNVEWLKEEVKKVKLIDEPHELNKIYYDEVLELIDQLDTPEMTTEDIVKIMVRLLQKTMNEDFDAPNFITTSVEDKETGEKFEFTVKRHEGMTPEEKLKLQEKSLNKIEDIIKVNIRGRVTDSHTLERIERALKHYKGGLE